MLVARILVGIDPKATTKNVNNRDLIWMTGTVIPGLEFYLRKNNDYNVEAERIYEELKSHKLSPKKYEQLVLALIGDPAPAWRCTAYLAIEAKPEKVFVKELARGLTTEVQLGLERRETRPLWRWLAAVDRLLDKHRRLFSTDFPGNLRRAAGTLRGRSDVDPGGECKSYIARILDKFEPTSPLRSMRK